MNGISWQSNKPSSVVSTDQTGIIQNPAMYSYSYDPKYQLTGATWGTPNFGNNTFTNNNTFSESGMRYDPNGNIQSLQRTGKYNDNFNYQYAAGTNKLSSVGNTGSSTPYASYSYDELGRMKSEQLTGAPNPYYLQYDVTGKITGIFSDAQFQTLKVAYAYDESGNRISRTDYTGSQPITAYYVYDASGNAMAIYNNTTITEIPVYGSGRLGTYYVAANNYVYEIKDNVGSVRLAINATKNSSGEADIIQFNDYYPFGSIAQSGGTGYRYDYQGAYAEKDPVTGFNNFELRMYDGRIGRWLSVDPMGQYYSPYVGMGNNPVKRFDPTGGYNPVYDEDGNFLGTDSWGLQGHAIIMSAEDFTQGMDHQTAEQMDLGLSSLSENALYAVSNHFNNLKNRPDYDGIVTVDEGVAWAKSHPNLGLDVKSQIYTNASPDDFLYMDASKMNFGSTSINDFTAYNVFTPINLLYKFNGSVSSYNTTYALGRTVMTLLDPQGNVTVENGKWNNYDWDYGGGFIRNALLFQDRMRKGINDTMGFPVYIYGTGHLNK